MSEDESRVLVLPVNISVPDAYYKGRKDQREEDIMGFLEDVKGGDLQWYQIIEKWEGRLNEG